VYSFHFHLKVLGSILELLFLIVKMLCPDFILVIKSNYCNAYAKCYNAAAVCDSTYAVVPTQFINIHKIR
jgi:hypothetical protein